MLYHLHSRPAGSETSTWCRLSTPPRRWPISDHRQRGSPPRWPFERSTSLLIFVTSKAHIQSPFIRNGHTPQAEAFHLIEKAHSFGMATPLKRKPFTTSKKPIHLEWPHLHTFIYTTPRSALDHGQSFLH